MTNLLIMVLVAIGLLLFTGGTLGILRLPDVYTRLHMAGKLDTLGSLTLLLGLAIYDGWSDGASLIVKLKILLLWVFVFLTSPTATHAMVAVGMRVGIAPWMNTKREDKNP
ncbi:MAG: monovalent cation/H(+) antiporter subunit G [Syntrophobacteraceae bacterium]